MERIRIVTGMAYDEWEHEYHLTERGWVPGSFYFRGTLAKKVPIPLDRVLTMVQENFNSTLFVVPQTSWREGWKSGCSQETIELLLVRYGHRPPEEITFQLAVRERVYSAHLQATGSNVGATM